MNASNPGKELKRTFPDTKRKRKRDICKQIWVYEETLMKRKFHRPGQIVKILREADAKIASGSTVLAVLF